MNILPVTTINHNKKYTSQNNSQNHSNHTPTFNKAAYLPAFAYQPNFSGGKSLNLEKTIEALDKLASKKSSVYPPNVREWAGMVIEEGNKLNETLIDIHKKFFSTIKECFTLAELKKKFPEFENVLSDNQVTYTKNSFIDEVKLGKLENFDSEEELPLQLIKLYWGEGFSLNDIKKYAGDKDVYATFKKLNIPVVDRTYGYMLKFSDPHYNERLTAEMAEKRLAALDKKAMINSGEPVYIPRGPMSMEHREHISQGLLKFYEEHPERLLTISERQKEFYRENPKRAFILRRVMVKAWNLKSAENIKKELSNFMIKNKLPITNEELEFPIALTGQKSALMKKFWDTNEWAKKKLSDNIKFGWKKVKEENETFYDINLIPDIVQERILKWAHSRGQDISMLKFKTSFFPEIPEKSISTPEINLYTRAYADEHPVFSNIMANTYFLTLLNTNRLLKKVDLEKVDTFEKELICAIKAHIMENLFENPVLPLEKNQFKQLETNSAQSVYSLILEWCARSHKPKYIKMLDEQLNKSFMYLEKNHSAGKPLSISPFGMDL